MSKSTVILWLVIVAAAAFYGGWWYGGKSGYDRGFTAGRAQSPETEVQVDTGYQNPFEGVKFNPFK